MDHVNTTPSSLLGNLLTAKQLGELIGLGECQIGNLVRQGKMPAPIKVGGLKNYWVRAEIESYLQAKVEERDRATDARRARRAA